MKRFFFTCSMALLPFTGNTAEGQTSSGAVIGKAGPFEITGIDSESVTFKASAKTSFYSAAFVSGDQSIHATFISNTVGNIIFANGGTALAGSQLKTPKANNWESAGMELPAGTVATCSFSNVPPGFVPQRVMFLTDKNTTPLYFDIPAGKVLPANTVKYENTLYTVSLGTIGDDGKGTVAVEILTQEKISIPTKNGVLVAPIMMKIEAGGKTLTASDKVSILDNSMTFNFGEVPDKVTVYGNDGNTDGPAVTFDVKKNMVKKTGSGVVAATAAQQPQPAVQQSQPAVQQSQPVTQQSQSTVQQPQPAAQQSQPEVTFTQKAKPLVTRTSTWRRWYIEAGLSIAVLVPDPVDVMTCVGGAIDFGVFFNPHNRLSLDLGIGGYGRDAGTFSYTKTYTDGTSEEFTDGVITRNYTSTIFLMSYHYVFTPSDIFHIRLGPSFGLTALSASLGFTPKVDNQPDVEEKSASMTSFGLGIGFTCNIGKRCFIDSGYRFLANTGLELEDFEIMAPTYRTILEITAPVHQINLTFGLRF